MNTFKAIYLPFLKKIIVNTLVVIAFAGLTQGKLKIDHPIYGFLGALLITILFTLVRPLLIVTVIITIFSLGLFSLLVRTILVYSVSYILAPHFEIVSFWTAAGLVIAIKIFNFIFTVSICISIFFNSNSFNCTYPFE